MNLTNTRIFSIFCGLRVVTILLAMGIGIVALTPRCAAQKPCGTERWPIKTLQDKGAGWMALHSHPKPATVAQLTAFPLHTKKELLADNSTRITPQETTVYEIHVVILGFKKETDQDFHIVVADPKNLRNTMIVEIPAGGCMAPAANGMWSRLQGLFAQEFGHPTATYKKLSKPVAVRIRGVGFFDFIHGQTGVAKNGFELHPVTDIAKE